MHGSLKKQDHNKLYQNLEEEGYVPTHPLDPPALNFNDIGLIPITIIHKSLIAFFCFKPGLNLFIASKYRKNTKKGLFTMRNRFNSSFEI